MILFKKAGELHNYLEEQRKTGKKIAFVPTMGALHEGHISLLEAAQHPDTCSVFSIFVNPTQFNDPADFRKYPITIDQDIYMLEKADCDILFLPSVDEIYPDGTSQIAQYDLGYLEEILEGKFRPGHFQGVCMVVHRLLSIVNPDQLYLGQKDYQQCMVIRRLLELTGMAGSTSLHLSPTLREADGLAMSSRNRRLDEADRKTAAAINKTLSGIKQGLNKGPLEMLIKDANDRLIAAGFKVDYVEIADASSLLPVRNWDGSQHLVALVAAFLRDVRLIDNMKLN